VAVTYRAKWLAVQMRLSVGTRLQNPELVQLDYELMTLRRRLSRAFLNDDDAEIARTRAEITELEGQRTLRGAAGSPSQEQ
jgi:hypothetical protein